MELEKDNSSNSITLNQSADQQDHNQILDRYLEKLVTIKRNFINNKNKNNEPSQHSESVLSDNDANETLEHLIVEENKSVSTNASIYEIVDAISDAGDDDENRADRGREPDERFNQYHIEYLRKAS